MRQHENGAPPDRELLTITATAQLLRVPTRAVLWGIWARQLPVRRHGPWVRVPRAELLAGFGAEVAS